VYLCSSLKEEFGISILEAMSAGFLVLGPRRGGVGTYVEHGASGFLVDTSSAESMQDALEAILGGDEYPEEPLAAIARAGQEFVTRNFSIENIAGRFSAFYRSLPDQSPRPGRSAAGSVARGSGGPR
jgi:glycosyltransferase involved in cell wall biosynthesis